MLTFPPDGGFWFPLSGGWMLEVGCFLSRVDFGAWRFFSTVPRQRVSSLCVQRPPCNSGLESGRQWPHTALIWLWLTLLDHVGVRPVWIVRAAFMLDSTGVSIRKSRKNNQKPLALDTISRPVLAGDSWFPAHPNAPRLS